MPACPVGLPGTQDSEALDWPLKEAEWNSSCWSRVYWEYPVRGTRKLAVRVTEFFLLRVDTQELPSWPSDGIGATFHRQGSQPPLVCMERVALNLGSLQSNEIKLNPTRTWLSPWYKNKMCESHLHTCGGMLNPVWGSHTRCCRELMLTEEY